MLCEGSNSVLVPAAKATGDYLVEGVEGSLAICDAENLHLFPDAAFLK